MADSPDLLKQRIQELTRLVNVSLVLNSTLAPDPLLRFIMDSASDLVGAESASILLIDHNTQDLVFAATSSRGGEGIIGQPVPLEGSIAGLILRENRPVAINDVTADPRHYRHTDEVTQFTTRSILGVPMRIRDRVVGVLEAVNKINGGWTVQNRSALMILASQAAVAIENARLVTALQRANEELSELDRMKNAFIAVAGHELRTPLGIILGYAAFLKEEAQGEVSSHADAVFRGAMQLRGIIEQLTNLSHLKQSPDVDLARARVGVADLLRAAEQDIAAMAAAKGHRLMVDLPPESAILWVDPAKIQAVLANLLNNAVKFTPAGGTITLSCEQRPHETWLRVSDTGIGIAPENQTRVFEEFFQVEDHLTRRYGGMGLGLSIARGFVEAHGGRLWVESPGVGGGATFFASLPLAEAAS
jgi:signal transduction histidine kinase